jgi:hypothetical protein
MAEPTLTFLYNKGTSDVTYTGTGSPDSNFNVIDIDNDIVVFTGGGITGTLDNPSASGTRDATIRPSVDPYIIPQVFVEHSALPTASGMVQAPMAGFGPSGSQGPYRYVFAVYVDGSMASDLYLEAWDDSSFSTTGLDVLQGSSNSSNESYVNAIRTTASAPPWAPEWDGSDTGAAFIRGSENARRLPLANAASISNTTVYFNIYIQLETDAPTFHNTPVFGFRYLYT